MAIKFPVPDSVGQIYTEGEKSWRWGGYTWDRVRASEARVTSVAPTDMVSGQMWIDKETGKAYYMMDGNLIQLTSSRHVPTINYEFSLPNGEAFDPLVEWNRAVHFEGATGAPQISGGSGVLATNRQNISYQVPDFSSSMNNPGYTNSDGYPFSVNVMFNLDDTTGEEIIWQHGTAYGGTLTDGKPGVISLRRNGSKVEFMYGIDWIDSAPENRKLNKCIVGTDFEPGKWYSVTVSFSGTNLVSPTANDLSTIFDIRVMSEHDAWNQIHQRSSPSNWYETGHDMTNWFAVYSFYVGTGQSMASWTLNGYIAHVWNNTLHNNAPFFASDEDYRKYCLNPVAWHNDLNGTQRPKAFNADQIFFYTNNGWNWGDPPPLEDHNIVGGTATSLFLFNDANPTGTNINLATATQLGAYNANSETVTIPYITQ